MDELLDALLINVSASIIKPLMQCSVKLDDLRLKKSPYIDLIQNKCLPVLVYGVEACLCLYETNAL